ncbi:hypothetical protein TNCV_3250361 [Trichonephila clavipes]|nr:hypothetical protein TNCV_3250361 [Trichonephila clavipes]
MVTDGTEFALGDIKKLFDEKLDETLRLNMKSGRNIAINGGQEEGKKWGSNHPVRRRHTKRVQRREQQYSSYSVEQGRSCGPSARSRTAQQQQRQERKEGLNSRQSQRLEVLVGDINYRAH